MENVRRLLSFRNRAVKYLKYRVYFWRIKPVFNYVRYSIPQGIQQLIAFAPIIWRNRDWDYEYLYGLIVFKLKRMEYLIGNGHCVNARKDAKQIKIARLALERLIDDNYWPDTKRRLTKEDVKRFEYRAKQDLDLFCKMFKNSRRWWD